MITINKLKQGVLAYIDSEFLPNVGGINKWFFGIGAGAYVNKIDEMLNKNADFLKEFNYLTNDNLINIEKIYNDFKQQAKKHGEIIHNIKLVGDVKFNEADIDKIYEFLRG